MLSTRVLCNDMTVSSIGLGCVGMSAEYGNPSDWNESDSLSTLCRAFDLGITLFDTADSYGPFTNEILLGKFIRRIREEITISTKSGLIFDSKLGSGGRTRLDSLAFDELEALAAYANRAAAITCSRQGANPPRKDELGPLSVPSEA